MWISKQMTREETAPTLRTGESTVNSNGGNGVSSTASQRSVDFYSPYGYHFSLPKSMNVLLAQDGANQFAIGVSQKSTGLNVGEIRIEAQSGAYVYLKNDGSVEINGLIISKDGVII